ncbi:MAG TPA: family 10 glycosylhydrolase [Nannocystis sp.]|jgi:uncharacterized lipoprotein YddW (UPF0748 family)
MQLTQPTRGAALLVCTISIACSGGGQGESTRTTGTTGTTGAGMTSGSTQPQPTTSGGTTGTGDLSESTAASETSGAVDTSTGGPTQDLVTVSHPRELRAAWVASVGNINFPSKQGLSAEAQQAELSAMFDGIAQAGLNTVILQVRPECDALYASEIEPWSRYLTGTQGEDPGYDPLEFAVTQAHARGLELHAWFNPYRAKASAGSKAAANHISKLLPQYAYTYGNFLWMDPGATEVQDQLVAVISDVVGRYDIDGVHFDDYFYPYPDGDPFPDSGTYDAYVQGGGQLGLGDWRRDNVNRVVERVGIEVAKLRPSVRWGISPFGIYRPGIPEGIQGLDQYDAIYADPVKWMQEGWLDYLAPQLYWPSTQEPQAYGKLIEWWSSITTGGRYIFAGNYLSKIGSDADWSLDELRAQIQLSRQYAPQGSQGNIYFHVAPILNNTEGFTDMIKTEFYASPALTPPIAALAGDVVAPPQVVLAGTSVTLTHEDPGGLRAWVLYRGDNDVWTIERIVRASEPGLELPGSGTWAISAAARSGVESAGVRIVVP